jgi:DNA-directed RNA polymerase
MFLKKKGVKAQCLQIRKKTMTLKKEKTLTRLVEDLEYRLKHLEGRQAVYKILSEIEPDKIDASFFIEFTYPHILAGIERFATLTEIISNMGHRLMQKLRISRDSIAAAQLGWFILISYFEENIMKYFCKRARGKGKHTVYQLKVTDWEAFQSLIIEVDDDVADMFPKRKPLEPWDGSVIHKETGRPLIRNAHKKALSKVKDGRDLSYLVDTLNKLNKTGWRINNPVFETYQKCFNSEKNPFKFSKEVDAQKKASLIIEAEAIARIGEKHLNETFYHLYNCDFRGRIYPNTAYLHEQSSDNSKGIILLDEPTALGDMGAYWLGVHTSNMWGNDKVSLDDRATWPEQNFSDIVSYAADPMINTGWMEADKPFCFLACCFEWALIQDWCERGESIEDFPSCLPIYVDGSNNGVQHLAAMSKDEEVAPLVNLVPQDLPGDVYMFIAEHSIANVKRLAEGMSKEDISKFEPYFKEIIALKRDCERWPVGSERNKLAYAKLKEFKNHNYDMSKRLWPLFWNRITDRKTWRKTVKRPVMTLGYGGTQYGMGEQIKDDTRGLSDYLRDKEDIWAYRLGQLVYETCYAELKGPARLLNMFFTLAERMNEQVEPITYDSPVTNFPFVHKYRKARIARAWLKYGEDKIRVQLQVWEDATLDLTKQKSGAAPNIVHSLDAVHLTMVVHDAPYTTTIVHDSFGCAAGNMDHMFDHVRKKFLELYQQEPLEQVMYQMDSLDLIPEKGNLDVRKVLESDYAFA